MTLESSANGESPDRESVELIWFPTGGGKDGGLPGPGRLRYLYAPPSGP